MNRLLALGCGYTATAFARALRAEGGWQITGTTRDPLKAAQMAAEGIEPLLLSGPAEEDACLKAAIAKASHIIHSASPAGGKDPFLALAPVMRAAKPAWFGYLSTTGVYGDTGGAWVDEEAPLVPAEGRSGDRAMAEAAWAREDLPLHIFRLAGIYGPGRGPFEKLRKGKALRILKPGQVFSRAHILDIIQVLKASMARPRPGGVYNVCDDLPASSAEVLSYAAELAGLPEPPALPIEEAGLSPMALSFYAECRRVRNDRIKDELAVTLICPDYRSGLRAILAAEGQQAL